MRNRPTITSALVLLALAASACTDAEEGQPDTEAGLRVAVEASTEALLAGDTDVLYGFLTEECRDTIDRQEFAEQMTLGMAFLAGFAEVDLDELEITEVLIEDFDGTTAMAGPVVDLPSGEGLFGEQDLSPWVYEDGGWKLDDCPDDTGLGDGDGDTGFGDDDGPEGLGERDQPAPVGDTLTVGDEWEVTVLGFEPDATEEVLAESDFALEPEPGQRLATVRVRATYVGEESGDPTFDLEYQLVGDAATGYVGGTDPLPPNELFPGGTAEGNVCFSVPDDEGGFALSVAPWFSNSDWWFELP
jgi:hypothetical protein